MTEREAIERIKECLVCEIMDREAGTSTDETVEALTMATDALKKQIPEQVNGDVDYYTCKCGAILVPMDNYCHDCGQRLKWGKE